MMDDSFEILRDDVMQRRKQMLDDVRNRYEALCGRYLTMPLGQLHIDIGTCLFIIDELLKPKPEKELNKKAKINTSGGNLWGD
jgi:hypothetical protein